MGVTYVLDMVQNMKEKQVNMGWRIQYKMAAGRKYEGKDKFECLHCMVTK